MTETVRLISLEGCADCAHVARTNLRLLNLPNTEVVTGPFEITLAPALNRLGRLDLVFFDGNHRTEPTLHYFEACLPLAHEHSVFVFDDVHGSPEMRAAWQRIQQHPRVTLTLDCFELACAFFTPDLREKQHLRVVPARWKPWKIF